MNKFLPSSTNVHDMKVNLSHLIAFPTNSNVSNEFFISLSLVTLFDLILLFMDLIILVLSGQLEPFVNRKKIVNNCK